MSTLTQHSDYPLHTEATLICVETKDGASIYHVEFSHSEGKAGNVAGVIKCFSDRVEIAFTIGHNTDEECTLVRVYKSLQGPDLTVEAADISVKSTTLRDRAIIRQLSYAITLACEYADALDFDYPVGSLM